MQSQSLDAAVENLAQQGHELTQARLDLESRLTSIADRERKATELEERLKLHLSAKVLEEHVLARQAELDDLVRLHKQTMADLKETEDVAFLAVKAAAIKAAAAQVEVRDQQGKLTAMTELVKEAKRTLAAVNKDVTARKCYLDEQELLIESTLQDGNRAVMATNNEVILLQEQKNELLRSIHAMAARLSALNDDTADEAEKGLRLKELYQTTAAGYRADLADLRTQAIELEATMTTEKATATQAKQANELLAQELAIKADTLQRRSDELELERRRIESRSLI